MDIFEQFNKLLDKAISKELVPRMILPNGDYLYRVEIHVIEAIGKYPEANLTDLAEILCVTKGAVSQKVKILEKKGYIKRYKNKANNKEVLFELTDFGKKIFKGHEQFHQKLNASIEGQVGVLKKSDIRKIKSILSIIEKHYETL